MYMHVETSNISKYIKNYRATANTQRALNYIKYI